MSSPYPTFAAINVSRKNRYPVQLRHKSVKTLEDLALRAQRMVARKNWWIKEVILARGATHVYTDPNTYTWGPLQKETATRRLTTSHRFRAVSGRTKDVIKGAPEVVAFHKYPYPYPYPYP